MSWTADGVLVRDGGGAVVARCKRAADAAKIVAAVDLVDDLAAEFPGFLTDEEVDGADLVDFLNDRIVWEGRYS